MSVSSNSNNGPNNGPNTTNTMVVPSDTDRGIIASAIEQWKDCDSKIKQLNQMLANLRKQRTTVSDIIIQKMQSQNVSQLSLKEGKMVCVSDQPFKPLNVTDLQNILTTYPMLSPSQAQDLAKFISDNRVRGSVKHKLVHKK